MKMSLSEQDSKISSSDNNEEVKEFVGEAVSSSLQEEDFSENDRPRVLIRGDEDDDPGSSSHSEVRSPIDADAEDSPSGSEETDSDRNGLYAPNTTGFPPSRSSLSNIPQSTQPQKTNPFAKAGPSEKPLIAPSRWAKSSSTSWTSTSSRLVIRPSSLNNSVSSTSSPFMNSTNLDQQFPSSCILRPPKLASTATVVPALASPSKLTETKNDEETSEAAAASVVQNENVNPVFVPLSCEENGKESGGLAPQPHPPVSAPTPSTSNSGDAFVFGCNLHERVTTNSKPESDSTETSPSPVQATNTVTTPVSVSQQSESCSSANSEELFSQEAQDRKRKFDDTPVVTGEEDESNVIQISCRLFAFNATTSNWIERGRGQLRLNDRVEENDELQSRLIIRTQGSLRVMLNTKVWSDMTVEKASDKSVRMTAMDNGVLRVFLIMATVSEAEVLYNALDWRVRLRKSESTTTTNDKDSPIKKKRTAEEGFCNDEEV